MNVSRFGARLLGAFSLLGSVASAQVLMLDFGATTAADGALTSSPYHSVTQGFTQSWWNKVGTGDFAAGSLKWSDETVAGSLVLNLGATTTADDLTIGLGDQPNSSLALGNNVTAGIYAGTSVAKDGIFTGSSGNTRAIGFQLTGLAAGTYDIFVTGRNTNTAATHSQGYRVGASSTTGDFDYTGLATQGSLTWVNGTSFTSSWMEKETVEEGGNYLKFTVTLTAGQALNLAAVGGTGEMRGFLNAVQIVAVPEPASAALWLGVVGLAGAVGVRRRRGVAADGAVSSAG